MSSLVDKDVVIDNMNCFIDNDESVKQSVLWGRSSVCIV